MEQARRWYHGQALACFCSSTSLSQEILCLESEHISRILDKQSSADTSCPRGWATDADGNVLRYDDGTIVTTGYIPSIRVFRLDAQDTVRGFTDSEINKLDTGEDIGEVIVNDRVYFSVLKTELRYSINDSLRTGIFFDAGSIKVNSFTPTKLRTSTGITTKFVTPVGSLDLDFGVKTRRKRFSEGLREEFGRLHFSIGFF